jgi:hypothetical protein
MDQKVRKDLSGLYIKAEISNRIKYVKGPLAILDRILAQSKNPKCDYSFYAIANSPEGFLPYLLCMLPTPPAVIVNPFTRPPLKSSFLSPPSLSLIN